MTSSTSFFDWEEVYNDRELGTALLDMLHHSTTLNIKVESGRLKEKRRDGLLAKLVAVREEAGMSRIEFVGEVRPFEPPVPRMAMIV